MSSSSSISSPRLPGAKKTTTFAMTSRDVVCNCARNPEICLKSTLCPCLALREIAQNIGYQEPLPTIFCLTSYPVYFFCKALTGHAATCAVVNLAHLGSEVAERRGITEHQSIERSCQSSLCNVFTCYMCRVLHESRLHKKSCQEEGNELLPIMEEEIMERGESEDKLEKKKTDDSLVQLIFFSSGIRCL